MEEMSEYGDMMTAGLVILRTSLSTEAHQGQKAATTPGHSAQLCLRISPQSPFMSTSQWKDFPVGEMGEKDIRRSGRRLRPDNYAHILG